MSSSSDTDEEKEQKLRESVIGVNFGSTVINVETNHTEAASGGPKKKSLRNNVNDEDIANVLQTTPEFRTFLAKKLDTFLDSEIGEKDFLTSSCADKDVADTNGIKLLSSSIVLVDGEMKINEKKRKTKKRKLSTSSDEDIEKLRSAAVTVDFIEKEAATIRKYQIDKPNKIDDGEYKEVKKRKKKKKKKEVDGT